MQRIFLLLLFLTNMVASQYISVTCKINCNNIRNKYLLNETLYFENVEFVFEGDNVIYDQRWFGRKSRDTTVGAVYDSVVYQRGSRRSDRSGVAGISGGVADVSQLTNQAYRRPIPDVLLDTDVMLDSRAGANAQDRHPTAPKGEPIQDGATVLTVVERDQITGAVVGNGRPPWPVGRFDQNVLAKKVD